MLLAHLEAATLSSFVLLCLSTDVLCALSSSFVVGRAPCSRGGSMLITSSKRVLRRLHDADIGTACVLRCLRSHSQRVAKVRPRTQHRPWSETVKHHTTHSTTSRASWAKGILVSSPWSGTKTLVPCKFRSHPPSDTTTRRGDVRRAFLPSVLSVPSAFLPSFSFIPSVLPFFLAFCIPAFLPIFLLTPHIHAPICKTTGVP